MNFEGLIAAHLHLNFETHRIFGFQGRVPELFDGTRPPRTQDFGGQKGFADDELRCSVIVQEEA
jgi:hypothetical protein